MPRPDGQGGTCALKKEKDREKEKKKKRIKKTSKILEKTGFTAGTASSKSAGKEALDENTDLSLPEPLEYFLQCVGGKWKMRILWALKEEGSLRYRLIRNKVTGITDMMLSQSLRELTECGLTIRRQFQEIPPRVEYEITAAGRELLPIFDKIVEWEKTFRPLLEEQKKASAESGND